MSPPPSDLHERIDAAESASADRTSLITLAIPPEEPLEPVRNRIERDHAEATYGDSEPANRHLVEALEETRRLLAEYDETPENGLVVYCGITDGEDHIVVFDDLPAPIEGFVYEHANEFDTTPLDAMTEPSATYGLLVVERSAAALGRLDGETIETVETLENDLAEDTPTEENAPEGIEGADLQSRQVEWKKGFFDDVADAAERAFLGDDPVDELLLGGTEITIEEFAEGDRLDHRLRDRLKGTFTVEYASEQGLRQLVDRAEARLVDAEDRPAREALGRFFDAVDSDEEPVAYGREDVEEALTYDAVGTLLLSESLPAEGTADLLERAEAIEAEGVLVPTDLERGEQFEQAFGGVGALLRFEIE
jgi:peptide chain release factor subunit 1